jgi:ribosome-associated protein
MPEGQERKPSKSRVKREMLALQKLGEALMDLPEHELRALPLPENLREAIELARSLSKRGALYRQKQYIGRLMREVDTEAIERAVASTHERRLAEARDFHHIESWRDRILADGESAVDEFLMRHPNADRQRLRALLRQARRARVEADSRRARRTLFRYLREILAASKAEADPDDGEG